MRILALEPYFGGSHRAFLEGWQAAGKHDWTVVALPPHRWKWRMRHAAVTMADDVNTRIEGGEAFDLLFCSDMLDLAEFIGLVNEPVRSLPSVVYFHENQLTYPVRAHEERDLHFGFTNFTTAVAATRVWFNSAFHRSTFLDALEQFLRSMPDYNCLEWLEKMKDKSKVYPQGIERMPRRGRRHPGPPRILWAARWEFDKNPDLFFEALFVLQERGMPFRVSVIGERFAEIPAIFDTACQRLADRIDLWGYQEDRGDYIRALLEADIVVSTADHEFFGVSVIEAVAAGCYPLLPRRLAYPELFGPDRVAGSDDFFYEGSVESLVDRLAALLSRVEKGDLWKGRPDRGTIAVKPYLWENLAPRLDDALDEIRSSHRS